MLPRILDRVQTKVSDANSGLAEHVIAEIECSRIAPIQAGDDLPYNSLLSLSSSFLFSSKKKSLSDLTELSSKESKHVQSPKKHNYNFHYEGPNRNAITLCSEINGERFQSAAGSPCPR